MREGIAGFAAAGRPAVVALACIVVASIAACGQPTAYGPIVGVRPVASPDAVNTEFDPSNIADALQSELTAANNTNAITGENKLAKGELPIENFLTLKQSERLAALQQLGATIIQNRLAAIAQVRRQVVAVPLALVSLTNKYGILYLLDAAAAGLGNMQRKIANDQLVDVARADVTAVAAFRVYGLLIPQVHMLVAAYEQQGLVNIYYIEANNWQQAITKAVLAGLNVGTAQASLNDMLNQISILNRDSAYALAVLPGLAASGYPGNRSTLANIRATLNAAGLAGSQAANDVITIKADLQL